MKASLRVGPAHRRPRHTKGNSRIHAVRMPRPWARQGLHIAACASILTHNPLLLPRHRYARSQFMGHSDEVEDERIVEVAARGFESMRWVLAKYDLAVPDGVSHEQFLA